MRSAMFTVRSLRAKNHTLPLISGRKGRRGHPDTAEREHSGYSAALSGATKLPARCPDKGRKWQQDVPTKGESGNKMPRQRRNDPVWACRVASRGERGIARLGDLAGVSILSKPAQGPSLKGLPTPCRIPVESLPTPHSKVLPKCFTVKCPLSASR